MKHYVISCFYISLNTLGTSLSLHRRVRPAPTLSGAVRTCTSMSVKSTPDNRRTLEEFGGRAANCGASSVKMSLSVCTLASTCTAIDKHSYYFLASSMSGIIFVWYHIYVWHQTKKRRSEMPFKKTEKIFRVLKL